MKKNEETTMEENVKPGFLIGDKSLWCVTGIDLADFGGNTSVWNFSIGLVMAFCGFGSMKFLEELSTFSSSFPEYGV